MNAYLFQVAGDSYVVLGESMQGAITKDEARVVQEFAENDEAQDDERQAYRNELESVSCVGDVR